ncbi:MAG: peptidylprolyl isomerase [Candidatus Binatia bacterium]
MAGLFLAGLLLALLHAVPAAAQETLRNETLVNGVIAAVDAFPITLRDLHEYETTKAMLLPPEDRKDSETVLMTMVRGHMFQAEFQEKGIVAHDEDVDLYIDNILQQTGSTREELEVALSEVGLTWADYYQRMREEVQRLALINREIRTRVNVTPEEVERYWKEHDEFDLPARVALSDIFIPIDRGASPTEYQAARRVAEEAYAMAKRDGFEAAAKAYSRGPTAAEGGRLGEFASGSMAPEFEAAVKGLKKGQISDPFTVGNAYHIVRLDERLTGGRVPLEQIQEQIRDQLYAQQLDERFRRWVEEDLVERHHVVIQFEEIQQLAAAGGP